LSNIGALVERLVDAGLSVGEASTIIAEAVAAGAASAVQRKSPGALRTEKWRENKRHKPSQTVTSDAKPEASQTVTNRHKPSQCDGDAILPIDTKMKKESRRGSATASRGTRIDPNWQPTPEDRAVATAEGFSSPETDREVLQFRDYWKSASGSNAVKLDWSATWRNWVRRTASNFGKKQKQSVISHGPPEDINWESIIEFKKKTGVWSKWAGPEPGSIGCKAPAELLQKYGLAS